MKRVRAVRLSTRKAKPRASRKSLAQISERLAVLMLLLEHNIELLQRRAR